MSKKINAIIVAGGLGKRMQTILPKQFVELKGKPILMHTIEKFATSCDAIYLVLPKAYFSVWRELVVKFDFQISVHCVEGGEERFFSVRNALDFIPDGELVLVHDSVRPLVTETLITNVINAISDNQGVIPVVPLKDSIRMCMKEGSVPVDRADYRSVQTPQGFESTAIKKAYKVPYQKEYTDDASVFETAGFSIVLVDGEEKNIKITTKEDLILADSIWV